MDFKIVIYERTYAKSCRQYKRKRTGQKIPSQNRTTGQTKKMAVQSEIMSNRGGLKDSIKMELYGTLFYKK